MNGEELDPKIEKGELCWVTQLYPISEEPKIVILPKPLQKLIDIEDLFHELNNLLPPRAHDHRPIKGVVMSQEGKLITFLSKALGPKNLGLSTYEKELMTILMAVHK